MGCVFDAGKYSDLREITQIISTSKITLSFNNENICSKFFLRAREGTPKLFFSLFNSFALSGLFIAVTTDAQGVRKGRENGKKSFFEKFTATLIFKTKRSALSPFLLDD